MFSTTAYYFMMVRITTVFDIEKYNGRGSLNKYEVWAEKEGKDLIAKYRR
jgi:hypothetical protein